MNILSSIIQQLFFRQPISHYKTVWQRLHIDTVLLFSLAIVITLGLFILYSASNQDLELLGRQGIRFLFALLVMFILAQIPPQKYRHFAPWLFIITTALLVAVLIIGHIGKGAQRWLSLGMFRFQPSEMMKLILPMTIAWFFHTIPLPPPKLSLAIASTLIIIPVLLIVKQPDLGTALLIGASGMCVILLAGIRWRLLVLLTVLVISAVPLAWHAMHDYQRERVLTFLNPERDPLGSGYHIIQSKIAIGSGGLFGKGWLHGTQSHLQFLPEHATDFIFAVCGEEFGLIGGVFLLLAYLIIIGRGLYISSQAQDTFSRLLAGSLILTFFISIFINIGMVTGLLPVVGVPLPLISFGGTSVVTVLASFGILMSIHTHRKLVAA
jgi:rod shape determining protein RodA